ncbi:MAG: [FeFe] hydrogenase H-cluster radical SAM maturase HydE [Holophaga sp.]|nr:[FeFe] hydrogenase H-cluster radical SAM maturase HydE [Holophaga sp.]
MDQLGTVLQKDRLAREDLVLLLGLRDPVDTARLRARALEVMRAQVGTAVYYRGIIELSNVCACDCNYCGIRAGNGNLERFTLSEPEVMDAAAWCARAGYGSLVLQAGERADRAFRDLISHLVRRIRAESVLPDLPRGLGITLSLGEQPLETYRAWHQAGAHRYLLRIETTDPELFGRIHPPAQTLAARKQALADLAAAGFLVGTGVMIGIPGQTLEMLADDITFFRDHPIDMIGMGPWLPHLDTPMGGWAQPLAPEDQLQLSLNMIATVRLACPDLNIASTTALQAMVPDGRERGLSYGANVTMPNLTPVHARGNYKLYEGKPCTDEAREECRGCLMGRVESVGRTVALNQWGDPPAYARRVGEGGGSW